MTSNSGYRSALLASLLLAALSIFPLPSLSERSFESDIGEKSQELKLKKIGEEADRSMKQEHKMRGMLEERYGVSLKVDPRYYTLADQPAYLVLNEEGIKLGEIRLKDIPRDNKGRLDRNRRVQELEIQLAALTRRCEATAEAKNLMEKRGVALNGCWLVISRRGKDPQEVDLNADGNTEKAVIDVVLRSKSKRLKVTVTDRGAAPGAAPQGFEIDDAGELWDVNVASDERPQPR